MATLHPPAVISVLEGRLARTWHHITPDRVSVITLFHDTITGLRCLTLDFEEVPGSYGNSTLFMGTDGHRIYFTINSEAGYIEIKREGWINFVYTCCIKDQILCEVTQKVATNQEGIFTVTILDTLLTADEFSENQVAWYSIKGSRLKDRIETIVHRRFKDFAELSSQVKQNFKGHHLRSSLPNLPQKLFKYSTDHSDPQFVTERRVKLNLFLNALISVPHVSNMVCVKAFLGLMDQVREFSIAFHQPTLGMSLIPPERLESGTPAIVGIIQNPEQYPGLYTGDSLSKVNGIPVAGITFTAVTNRIKSLSRPLIIHFVQIVASCPADKRIAAQIASKVATKSIPFFSGDQYIG